MTVRHFVNAILCAVILAAPLSAQWSSDPAVNLAIADRTGEQTQPKVHATADGGCYISWFDNSTGGYDVYLQRLDASGVEQWAHNGVLVADRSFSSTQNYGMDVDGNGNALLTFRDDRFTGTQITATLIDPTGAAPWGPNGVQLTNTTDFVAAPKIAATSDGDVVVSWTHNANVVLQRLDAAGAPEWGGGVVLSDTAGGEFLLSDLHGAGAGDVIVSWNRQQSFMAAKHIWAQKLDPAGNLLWAPAHVRVFDGGSLQFGNFPTFVSDGAGGAVFGWYEVSPLQCRAQRILSGGTEAFTHNGVVGSTFPRERVAPSVAFDATTSSTYLFWREQVGPPTPQDGVYGQRFDSAGTRQWTDDGVVVVALSATEKTQVRTLALDSGAIVSWVEALTFGNQLIDGERLDGDGNTVWPMPTAVSTVTSGKSRLAADLSSTAAALLVWADDRDDANDVYAQNVNASGTLGPDVECFTHADCADVDRDGIRDDGCVWWDCVKGLCASTDVIFGDMGGQFGQCPPDGTSDGNDRFHALNCFSDFDPSGGPSYTCEDDPPMAFNVDTGGQFGSCAPDGVCDGNDAFAALNAFAEETSCSCPLDGGPAPEIEPQAIDRAEVLLRTAHKRVRPGGLVEIEVHLASELRDLRGYQVHLGVVGGTAGVLELVDIAIRPDSVLSAMAAPWSAFNLRTQQVVVGLDEAGVSVKPGHLATFTYRASRDASGSFGIELLADAEDAGQRSYLFPTPAHGMIAIAGRAHTRIEVSGHRAAR